MGKAVKEGRRREFSAFYNAGEPPDPQSELTFLQSALDHNRRKEGAHQMLWDFYRELIRLRKEEPALRELDESVVEVNSSEEIGSLFVRRSYAKNEIYMVFNFGDRVADFGAELPVGQWRKQLDSAETRWMGPGSHIPQTFSVTGISTLKIQPRSLCVLKRSAS